MTDPRAAAEALAHVPDIDVMGELPLSVRQRLMERLARLLSDDGRTLEFVAQLGIVCAKKAWPVWQSAFLLESWPMDLAEAAVSSIGLGADTSAVSSRELLEAKTYLDDKLLLGQEYFPAVCAGFASWAVARDILSWNRSKPLPGDSELRMSPEEWDPCFFASLAMAGGATWEGTGSTDARRDFWNWYLTSALPDAFAAASEN